MRDVREMFRLAYTAALESPDPSTQVGAVLVSEWDTILGVSCNDFPAGVALTPERLVRPLKYQVVEHAERNVLYQAAKNGRATTNTVMFAPWAACTDCARAMIQCGVKVLYRHAEACERSSSWAESITVADEMLVEAGIEVINWNGKVFTGEWALALRHSEEIWFP